MEVASESKGSSPFMESQPPASKTRRRQILYTCGVSLLTMAHKVYKRAVDIHCPLCFLTHLLASLARPIVNAMQYQWLAILSFADDRILAIEDTVEAVFPPSAYVFNKIDSLVAISETLPRKFDSIMDYFLTLFCCLPILNWATIYFCETLNSLLSALIDWAYGGAKEVREITIHVNCDEPTNAISLRGNPNSASPVKRTKTTDNLPDSDDTQCDESNIPRNDYDLNTYREMMGEQEGDERAYEKRVLHEEEEEEQTQSTAQVSENNDMIVKEEPILDLFDAGWHMKPLARK